MSDCAGTASSQVCCFPSPLPAVPGLPPASACLCLSAVGLPVLLSHFYLVTLEGGPTFKIQIRIPRASLGSMTADNFLVLCLSFPFCQMRAVPISLLGGLQGGFTSRVSLQIEISFLLPRARDPLGRTGCFSPFPPEVLRHGKNSLSHEDLMSERAVVIFKFWISISFAPWQGD